MADNISKLRANDSALTLHNNEDQVWIYAISKLCLTDLHYKIGYHNKYKVKTINKSPEHNFVPRGFRLELLAGLEPAAC